METTIDRKIPDKCIRCSALSAAAAKALHGETCWDSEFVLAVVPTPVTAIDGTFNAAAADRLRSKC